MKTSKDSKFHENRSRGLTETAKKTDGLTAAIFKRKGKQILQIHLCSKYVDFKLHDNP